jgi:hypothetical protein
MKSFSVIALCSLLAVANLMAEVEVIFENPDEYRDIDFYNRGNKKGQEVYLPQFEKYIVRQGQRYLAEGQTLTMTILDIDLAGMYEPWRTPPADDIRIVKSLYPPRIKFRYELSDADGTIIKSGEESLLDMGFDFRIRINYHDDLFYEKEMIRDWLRKFNRKE